MSLTLSALGLVPPTAGGTTMLPPEDRSIYSPDRRFELKITVKDGLHRLRSTKGFGKTLWSFTRPLWYDDYFVGADGRYVAWVNDDFVNWLPKRFPGGAPDIPAIILYSADGEVARATFRQIGGSRPRRPDEAPGPISEIPPRQWRETMTRKGEQVTLLIPNGTKVEIDLALGKIILPKKR